MKPHLSLCISISLLFPAKVPHPLASFRVPPGHKWYSQIWVIQGRFNKGLFTRVWAGCKEAQRVEGNTKTSNAELLPLWGPRGGGSSYLNPAGEDCELQLSECSRPHEQGVGGVQGGGVISTSLSFPSISSQGSPLAKLNTVMESYWC